MVIQIMRDLNLVYQKPNGIRLIVRIENKKYTGFEHT